jgi:hypothetical protein
MATQLNPALARLWIADNARQYGYRKALAVTDLTEPQQRLLDFFELGLTAAQRKTLPELAKADTAEVDFLEKRIQSVLWESPTGITQQDVETRFAEIARALLQGADPLQIKTLRKSKSVFIEKLDSTGLTIAKALALAGIGRQISTDQTRVSQADISELGYVQAQLGIPRVRAAQGIVGKDLQLHSRISSTFDAVSLAVLLTSDITNPASYQTWLARDVAHLAIVFDEEGVEVSPIVVPGETSCLGCYEKHRLEHTPYWPVIAPQLLALDRSLADSAMLLFASGVVVNQVLNYLDLEMVESNALRLNRDGTMLSYTPEAINCGCRVL